MVLKIFKYVMHLTIGIQWHFQNISIHIKVLSINTMNLFTLFYS